MKADARGRPIPVEFQSPDGTRDCWKGFVRLLMNLALAKEHALPDRVSEEQERQGRRYVGDAGIELFSDLSERVRPKDMRPGDAVVFVLKKVTHIGLVVDKAMIAHVTDSGICRTKRDAVLRYPVKVLRYNGPGAQVFA